MVESDERHHAVPKYVKLVYGGIAGMIATTVVHPLDVLKIRRQLDGPSVSTMYLVRRMAPNTWYSGLSAALLRQCTYTSTRLGVFSMLMDEYKERYGRQPALAGQMGIGLCAGLAGAVMGSPAEVVLIRMMADGKLPPDSRRYKNTLHALYQISRHEGLSGLWRGVLSNISRAAVLSVVQISSYTQAQTMWQEQWSMSGLQLHFCSAVVSGFSTTVCSLPIDNIKTRLQVDNKFGSMRELVLHRIKTRGFRGAYKGFVPYFLRLTLHTFISFYILERFNKLHRDSF